MDSPDTDADIVAKSLTEKEAFAVLISRYEGKLSRYIARLGIRDEEDRSDVLQNVFIKVYQNLNAYDSSLSFSSWIYRIAHNEFINAIKKKGKEPFSFFDFDILFPHPISKDNTEKNLNREELRKVLDDCLGKLKPKYREPIVLYYFEELSYKEIADVLRIPISTVGVRLQRGKKIMKSFCKKLSYG